MLGQAANRGDLCGTDAYTRFGFDAGPQLQVAQGIQTIVGQRPVRINGSPQQQADLVRYQPPDCAGPLFAGQAAQFGEEFPGGRLILARGVERFGKSATLRKGRQPWGTHDRGIAGVRPAVAKQRLEGSSTLGGRDRCAGAFGQRGSAANLGPCSPGD